MYDVIIIGSGAAGLSASVYAKRAGLNLVVLEKSPMSGGQILNTYEVDNYLGLPGINGFDMGMKFREHADKLEVPFKDAEVLEIKDLGDKKIVRTDKEELETKSIILATGAHHALLGAPGEAKLSGMGVSYCATCDGAFYRKKTVAVVGGGDVALEDAIFLSRFADKVYLIHRRDQFRGAAILVDQVKAIDKIEIVYDTVVDEIVGEEKVDHLLIRNVKSNVSTELPVNGVFMAVGIMPNADVFSGLADQDESGYFIAGEDCVTSTPGIFAAGDIRTKQLRQVITAASDGANSITSVSRYLQSL